MINNDNIYFCKRLRLYNWLCNNGFTPIDKIRDVNNPKFYIWLFDETIDLINCVSSYYERDYFKCK